MEFPQEPSKGGLACYWGCSSGAKERKSVGKWSAVYLFGQRISEEKVQKELARYKDKKDIEKRQLPDGVTIQDASVTPVISLSQPQENAQRSTDLERIRTSSTPFSMADYFQSLECSIIQSRSPTPISEFGWLLSNIGFVAPRTTLSLVESSNY
jgi:hypothetical protein